VPWEPKVLEGNDAIGGEPQRDAISTDVERESTAIYDEVRHTWSLTGTPS
jgi:hypothetical protein